MKPIAQSEELVVAVSAAREAGALLLKYFGKVEGSYKADKSIVTVADIKAEELIRSRIREKFPDHAIVGEEMGGEGIGSPYVWSIDPLDGTTNFVVRNPFFAVSIALVRHAEPMLGVVYYPFADELFHAVKGGGAFLNDESIAVSTKVLDSSVLTFCNNRDVDSVNRMVEIFARLKPVNNKFRQMGAGSLELSYVACGRVEAFMMVGANPWDVAAGAVLVREAGGIATDFDGSEYDLNSKDILATNGLVHEELLRLVSGRPPSL